MPRKTVAFDEELCRGLIGYQEQLGWWWQSQSENAAHGYAYRKIADYLRASFSRSPGLMVDYACGAGNLLSRLCTRFPDSRLVGLDGSPFLLDHARRRLKRLGRRAFKRVTLIETPLPNFDLQIGKADVALFTFPNMVPSSGAGQFDGGVRCLDSEDHELAGHLAHARDAACARESESPESIKFSLLSGRLVSCNLRGLLKKDGICVRVEYGRVRRDELAHMELTRISFEEGSLDFAVNGRLPRQWFRTIASSTFRSGLIEDVYQQTGASTDKAGGYLITVLRAI